MLQLLITVGGIARDYSQYIDWKTLQITEQINIPAQATFSLTPSNIGFTPPPQRAYVQVWSSKYGSSIFSGFVASEPVRQYVAKAWDAQQAQTQIQNVPTQLLQYNITCTSDEYLLNIKSVPFIPAFVNRTQGQILSGLAEILCPDFFDTSNVMDGDVVPYYQYDPTKSWCEIAKNFGDGSRYRYKVRDKKIWYVPYGDGPFGISYNEQKSGSTFTPKDLQTNVLTTPIVNDVTIVGDVEAGNNHDDYFIGDGFTGNFPLLHKMFRGFSTQLLQETWTNQSLNTQQWFLQDPGVNFDYLDAPALNVVTAASGAISQLGLSYLGMNNAIEVGGGVDIEGGEFVLADYCHGIVNGIYTDTSYAASGALAGFQLSSPNGVVFGESLVIDNTTVPAMGVSGVLIQPQTFLGPAGPIIVSQINHSYVLQMVISAPKFTRYQQLYRTVDGGEYGGATTTEPCTITFIIQDYDVAAASSPTGFFYQPDVTQYTVENVTLPAFVAYALINNLRLNVSVTNTTVAIMPVGSLSAFEGPNGLYLPTGLILPMLPQSSGGYIGGVQPWPSQASGNILPLPGKRSAIPTNLVLGNGFELQAAQISQGNSADTLAFYNNSLPAAGTPIHLQSFEAQAAVSRLQDQASILAESYVVGDDGIRSAIVTDLNPLPRTSEDADNAALAYLQDRTGVFYNGTYLCTSLFFKPLTSDLQFWPTVGRFIAVNAPRRGITNQQYLVTQLTVAMLDPQTELVQFQIQFGADLHLEKVLKNFVDLQPVSVLTPQDKANPPNPRYTQNVDTSYLPDLANLSVAENGITDNYVTVNVNDFYFGDIEVRRLDTNWGRGPTPDFVSKVRWPQFQLQRQGYDQQWFMRPVYYNPPVFTVLATTITATAIAITVQDGTGIANGDVLLLSDPILKLSEKVQVISGGGTTILGVTRGFGGTVPSPFNFASEVIDLSIKNVTSRRSKVIRVRYPQTPTPPVFISQASRFPVLQFDFSGDQRNIYGFELRAADNQTIIVQKPVASQADLQIDLTQTPFFTTADFADGNTTVYAYFWNQQWSYSNPTILIANVGPGVLSFTPALYTYGMLTAENVTVNSPNNLVGIDWYLVYVDELSADIYATLNAPVDNATDPLTVVVAQNPDRITPSSTLQWASGQWLLFNQANKYEWGQIISTSGGIPPASGNFGLSIRRHYPGAPPGYATFGSLLASHVAGSGCKLMIGQVRRFLLNSQTGAFNGALPPTRFDMALPAALVGAIVAAPYDAGGNYGTWIVYNCATAQLPGIRTLTGGDYTFQYPGNITAVSGAFLSGTFVPALQTLSKSVQYQQPIRTIFAYTGIDGEPQNNDIHINIVRSSDQGVTWEIIAQLVIPVGVGYSWPSISPPGDQQEPYTGTWPFPILYPDDIINFTIEQGDGNNGLVVEIFT